MQEKGFVEVLRDIISQGTVPWLLSNAENCPKMINLRGNTHLADKESEGHKERPVQVDSGPEEESVFVVLQVLQRDDLFLATGEEQQLSPI